MKCNSCGIEIPPVWTACLRANICPACSKPIMVDELKDLISGLTDAMEKMPHSPEGLACWLVSNYKMKKINDYDPVEKFYDGKTKQSQSNDDDLLPHQRLQRNKSIGIHSGAGTSPAALSQTEQERQMKNAEMFLIRAGLNKNKIDEARMAKERAVAMYGDSSSGAGSEMEVSMDDEGDDGEIDPEERSNLVQSMMAASAAAAAASAASKHKINKTANNGGGIDTSSFGNLTPEERQILLGSNNSAPISQQDKNKINELITNGSFGVEDSNPYFAKLKFEKEQRANNIDMGISNATTRSGKPAGFRRV